MYSLWYYLDSQFGAGDIVRICIYDNTGSFPTFTPNNLLGQTGDIEGEGVSKFYGANLITPVALTNGAHYWISIHSSNSSVNAKNDTGGQSSYGEIGQVSDTYSDGPMDPWSGGFTGFGRISAYADEDAIGGDGAVAAALAVL